MNANSIANFMASMKSFRPMYVFTMLGALVVFELCLLTLVLKTGENNTVVAVINTALGATLAMIGQIVNHEFGGTKGRDTATRATDPASLQPGVTPAAPKP